MGKNLVYQLPLFWHEDKVEQWKHEGTILDDIKLLIKNLSDTGFEFQVNSEKCILTVRDPEINTESDFSPDNFLKIMHWTRVFYIIGNYDFQPQICFLEFTAKHKKNKRIFLSLSKFAKTYQLFTNFGQLDETISFFLSQAIATNEVLFINSLNKEEIEIIYGVNDSHLSMFLRTDNIVQVKFSFKCDNLHF
jgi:hypothetical protein